MYTITSEIIRELTVRSEPSLHHFQILKLWIDEYVGIVADRHAILSEANKLHQPMAPLGLGLGSNTGLVPEYSLQDYSPLIIQVPNPGVDRFGGDQATAVPPPSQINLSASTELAELDLGSYGPSIDYSTHNLGTPFQFQPSSAPRQSSVMRDMRDYVEPKTELYTYQ